MAAAEDAAGLFAAAPGSPEMGAAQGASKRVKLYPYDQIGAKLFNPFGESVITRAPLEDLWKTTTNGSKKVAFYSLLAADQTKDSWRVGAGISITAQSILAAIEQLELQRFQKVIVKELYEKAMTEATALKPVLEVLNFGKGGEKDTGASSSLSSLKRKKQDSAPAKPMPTEPAVNDAIKKLHDWLQQKQSPLRGLLTIVAGEGTFYAAHCAEKTARACISCKPASVEDWKAAANTRRKSAKPVSEAYAVDDDLQGLFGEE